MIRIGLREIGLLFGTRLLLILRLPLLLRHAVDDLARVGIGESDSPRLGRLAIPAAQTVPTEPGEVHHVDVLHIGPLAQMVHQAAERGGLQLGTGLLVELLCGHGWPPLPFGTWRVRASFAILAPWRSKGNRDR